MMRLMETRVRPFRSVNVFDVPSVAAGAAEKRQASKHVKMVYKILLWTRFTL